MTNFISSLASSHKCCKSKEFSLDWAAHSGFRTGICALGSLMAPRWATTAFLALNFGLQFMEMNSKLKSFKGCTAMMHLSKHLIEGLVIAVAFDRHPHFHHTHRLPIQALINQACIAGTSLCLWVRLKENLQESE